jgi:triosephosphate isomerase
MRKKVIAGNWKMHNDINESEILINSLITVIKG